MKRPYKKRLNIEVDELTHQAVKEIALKRNITIRKWIIRVIIEALKKEQQYN